MLAEYKRGSKCALVLIAFHLTLNSMFYLFLPSTPFPHYFFIPTILQLLSVALVFFFCLWIHTFSLPISDFVFFLLSFFLFSSFLPTVWLAGASGEEGGCLGLRYCFACPRQSSSLPTHKLCVHYSLSLVHRSTHSHNSCFQSYTYLCSIILQS